MQVKYTAYKLVDQSGKEVLVSDFRSPITVPKSLLPVVLSDLQNFLPNKSAFLSELGVELDGVPVMVARQPEEPTIKFLPPQTPGFADSWRNPYILVPFSLNPGLLSQLEFLLKQKDNKVDKKWPDLPAALVEKGGQELTDLYTLHKKILDTEAVLSLQKQKDQEVITLGELEAGLAEMDAEIQSVRHLLQKQEQIGATLQRYGHMIGQDLEAQAQALRKEIEAFRLNELNNQVNNYKRFQINTVQGQNVEAELEGKGWQAPFLAALAGVLLLMGLVGYFIVQSELVLVLGVLSGISEFALFALANYFPPQIDYKHVEKLAGQVHTPQTGHAEENSKGNRISQIERFFVDKAWIVALKNELAQIVEKIKEQLQGKDMGQINQEYKNLRQNIENLKQKIETYKTQELVPEEYLKKRRELDVLSVDKARQEREIGKQKPELLDEYLGFIDSEMESKAEVGGESVWQLPGELAQALGISEIKVGVGAVYDWLANLTQEQVWTLYIFLMVEKWQAQPISPLVVVDHLTGISEQSKVVVSQKLASVAKNGQQVFVDALLT